MSELSELISLPAIPLRDVVAFPGMTLPLFIGRTKSINAMNMGENIFLITQKDPVLEEPKQDDLYKVGVLAVIKEIITLPDKTAKALIESKQAAKIIEFYEMNEAFWAKVKVMEYKNKTDTSSLDSIALRGTLCATFEQYLKIQKRFSAELMSYLENIQDSFDLAYIIATHADLKSSAKQEILEEKNETKLIEKMIKHMENAMEIFHAERRIRSRVKSQIEKNQKEYYLNEQIKAIQRELGEADDFKEEIKELEKKIEKNGLPEKAKNKALNEIKKLKYISPLSSEAGIIRNYLDFFINLPWNKFIKTEENLIKAKEILDKSHYGMEKAKDRIFELIIQRKRVKDITRSPVLCFYGSPGTGKTSLAHAAGLAMGIPVVHIPLGGIKDEAVLRGHRRTYIGAMPGKIIQAVKDAQSSNLLIVFDEIGSMGTDFRGNPEDVLLEVFDPIQNKSFQDHYVEEGFDLSNVIFMATTNSLDLKPALLDRLEIIEISGYAQEEKYQIVEGYTIPKLLKEHGMTKDEFVIDQNSVIKIIREYTYESGVRGLEQNIAKLMRKAMRQLEETNIKQNIIDDAFIKKYLGHPLYSQDDFGIKPSVGIATGLAYIQKREGQEGEVLYIEAKKIPGDGKIECTGRLGEVMKESTQVAFKYLVANADLFGVSIDEIKKHNIHIHVPSGAVPKDGPSAGVALFFAMLSAITNRPLRSDIAITGEISLYKILKVGGIKEKILAAYRRNPKINTVFIPFENTPDLDDIPENVKTSIEIIPVKYVTDMLDAVFAPN